MCRRSLAEHAELREVEGQHLDLAVAAVLELHAVALRLLARLDELPALVHRKRGRHLREHMLAALHRRELDRHVQAPRRGVVDDVHVRVVAEPLPGRVAQILLRGGLLPVGQHLLRLLDLLLHVVADGRDRDARQLARAVDDPAAARAHAHDAQPDVGDRGRGISVHRRADRPAKRPPAARRAAGGRSRARERDALEEISSVLHD